MKRTAFHAMHLERGAKMVPFAGFEMPVQYTGIIDEHRAVRSGVGVFDVSHMGELEVRGPGALAFLQRMTVNDVSKLTEGKVQYSAMCNERGGIIDDLLVYHCGDRYMLVVNAANIAKDLAWLRSHAGEGVELRDVSDATSLLAVQGPQSVRTMAGVTEVGVGEMPYYTFRRGRIAGHDVLVSRTGYTGEVGFELYFASDEGTARDIWNAVFEAGKPHGIVPAGLGARDTLRLEMGFCLYGNDIDDETTPLQAGLGWITKLGKGAFVGRDVLEREKAEGPPRRLHGFVLPGRTIARKGMQVRRDGSPAGSVTSGTFSPTLERSIAMGYVAAGGDGPVDVDVRGTPVPVEIVQPPFYRRDEDRS